MIEFKFEPSISELRCIFDGRMDSPTSMEVEKELQARLQNATREIAMDKLNVVFDLAKVDYIASAFMRICLQTAKMVERGKFSVKNTNPFVMKIFVMTGLEKELNVS